MDFSPSLGGLLGRVSISKLLEFLMDFSPSLQLMLRMMSCGVLVCAAVGGPVGRISKLLEFLVNFSPYLRGLEYRSFNSKLLEFLVMFSPSL